MRTSRRQLRGHRRRVLKVGYIIASAQVIHGGYPIGYLYRETPDNPNDSGWRVFSGLETQAYADDPANFAQYNASTVVELHPDIRPLLGHDFPIARERVADTEEFVVVERNTRDDVH
jgi:hypothetical protein